MGGLILAASHAGRTLPAEAASKHVGAAITGCCSNRRCAAPKARKRCGQRQGKPTAGLRLMPSTAPNGAAGLMQGFAQRDRRGKVLVSSSVADPVQVRRPATAASLIRAMAAGKTMSRAAAPYGTKLSPALAPARTLPVACRPRGSRRRSSPFVALRQRGRAGRSAHRCRCKSPLHAVVRPGGHVSIRASLRSCVSSAPRRGRAYPSRGPVHGFSSYLPEGHHLSLVKRSPVVPARAVRASTVPAKQPGRLSCSREASQKL